MWRLLLPRIINRGLELKPSTETPLIRERWAWKTDTGGNMRALDGVLCQGLMARLGICRVQSEADRVMILKSSCGTRAGGTFL